MESMLKLVRFYVNDHPESAARALEGLNADEITTIVMKLSPVQRLLVVEHMALAAVLDLLGRIEAQHAARILEGLDPRRAASLLQSMKAAARDTLLRALPEKTSRELVELMAFPDHTAGALMDPMVTTFPVESTVKQAIELFRKAPRSHLFYLYVTDREGKLVGVLTMRDLLLAQPKDPIEPLVRRGVVTLLVSTHEEQIAEIMRQHKFVALPVLDADARLVGVVRYERVLEEAQEDAFEDLQQLVGAGKNENAMSPVRDVVRTRLPWLFINLLTAFAASAVVGIFESVIAKVTALAVLMPIVAGQGGNTGAQALAVVIRGLALREIPHGKTMRVVWKESSAALLNGLAIALITALAVWAWDGRLALALVIGMAMVVNMAAAGCAGAAIPIALKACGLDPAQSSSIVLTTFTDVIGFASFLGFAMLFMPMLVP